MLQSTISISILILEFWSILTVFFLPSKSDNETYSSQNCIAVPMLSTGGAVFILLQFDKHTTLSGVVRAHVTHTLALLENRNRLIQSET